MHTEKMDYIFNFLLPLHSWISSRATEAKDKQLMQILGNNVALILC